MGVSCTPEEMIDRLRGLASELKEPMKKVMIEASAKVQGVAMENVTPGKSPYRYAPFDTGLLRAHISYEVADQGNFYTGRVGVQKGYSNDDGIDLDTYALYVHDGTRPHNAPMEAIQKWAERKSRGGSNFEWFPVWLKIATQGTEPKPFLTDAVSSEQENVFRIISDGMENFLKIYCGRYG